jgi:hypothetical protein
MTNRDGNTGRKHPGIQGGHFFEKGLSDSQEAVNDLLLVALEESAKALAAKHGGRVERI